MTLPEPARSTASPGALLRSALWRRHALTLAALSLVAMLPFFTAEVLTLREQSMQQAVALQQAVARRVSERLDADLDAWRRQVDAVIRLPLDDDWLGLPVRQEEYGRLLRLAGVLDSVEYRDGRGTTVLVVSRSQPDRVAPASRVAPQAGPEAVPSAAVSPAPVVSRAADGRPVLQIGFSERPAGRDGVTLVQVSLLSWAQELADVLRAPGLRVWVQDSRGQPLLHADVVRLLSPALLPALDGVPAALHSAPRRDGPGEPVLRTTQPVPALGWWLVVEQPWADVTAPVQRALWRATFFILLALVAAALVSGWWAARLTRPIRQLHDGARRLAAGQEGPPLQIRTGDELQELAEQFDRMAASLRANLADLEAKVEEKTRHLALASRHKSEFLANMSHELRTPLNAILGFADVLGEGMAGELNEEQREYVGDIRSSGVHLLALINDVLDLSKIEAGQLELDWGEVDIATTVLSALALVRQRAQRQGLALRHHLPDRLDLRLGPGLWPGDARRLKQVLLNLLGNAVKFTATGWVECRLGLLPAGSTLAQAEAAAGAPCPVGLWQPPGSTQWTATAAGDGGLARPLLWLQVRDSGPGIPAPLQEAIFEPFVQVGEDRSGKAEGSGLGLPLARRLVRQHGGEITLLSAPGQGACFTVWLPEWPDGPPGIPAGGSAEAAEDSVAAAPDGAGPHASPVLTTPAGAAGTGPAFRVPE